MATLSAGSTEKVFLRQWGEDVTEEAVFAEFLGAILLLIRLGAAVDSERVMPRSKGANKWPPSEEIAANRS